MTQSIRRLLVVGLCACVAACSSTDADAHGSAKSATATSTASIALPATHVADGNVALAGSAPFDSITDLADRGRIAGSASSKLWVIMVSDFQCPYCKQWHDAQFATVLKNYADAGKIRLAFINFPLSMHPNAVPAAEAAMCASVQNKFWPMHEAIFASQDDWAAQPNPTAKLEALASKIPGIDMAAWKTCVAKHLTLPLIEADRERYRGAGVQSTPTFFVNGKMVAGPDGTSLGASANVAAAIEAALKKS